MEKLKTIENIFKVHPLTYLFIIISFFTGNFKKIILFMSLIIFHEIGHLLTAKLFNWKIDKIYLYPLGGLTKFNEKINKPFKEELLVTIMGPIFQIILANYLIKIDKDVKLFNTLLLCYNLLPIIPLDGSKLISLLFQKITPYKTNLKLMINISYLFYFILIISLIILRSSIIYVLISFLLFFKIQEEKEKINIYFNKFLLERTLYNVQLKKVKIIKSIKKMYRFKKNLFNINGKLFTEKEMIDKFFKNENAERL